MAAVTSCENTLYIDKLTSIDINKQFFLHCVSTFAFIFSLIFVKSSCFNTSLKDSSKSELNWGKKAMINTIYCQPNNVPTTSPRWIRGSK